MSLAIALEILYNASITMGMIEQEHKTTVQPEGSEPRLPGSLFSEEIFRGREEVQGLTIDPINAHDHDDAIWLDEQNGSPTLHISIADIATLMPQAIPPDTEAFERAFSRYEPPYRPMLSGEGTADMVSLKRGERRPTITISIPAKEGEAPTIRKTFLTSQRTLGYERADAILMDPSDEAHEMLVRASSVAQLLLDTRRQHGALALYDLQQLIETTEEGFLERIPEGQAHRSHVIVQEFMILANQTVAEWLTQQDVPMLYRNHTAKKSAGDQRHIFARLQQALAHPDMFDISTEARRLRLILNRASYGPINEGHFGLNLPAYSHFTSPIRRYADVINHRQVLAVLDGTEPPYSVSDLAELAEHINAVENEIKDERKVGRLRTITPRKAEGKEASAAEAEKTTTAGGVVFPTSFDEMPPQLREQLLMQLHEGKLTQKQLFSIMFGGERGEEMDMLRREVLDYLEQHPNEAVSLFAQATQKRNWSKVRFSTRREGTVQDPIFRITARVSRDGREFRSPEIVAETKKRGEQQATVSLLRTFIEVSQSSDREPLPPRGAEVLAPLPEGFDPKINFKGMLLEAIVNTPLGTPAFEILQSGSQHQPRFSATASLSEGNVRIMSEPASAPTKKLAEQLAAYALLQKLGISKADRSKKTKSDVIVNDNNYISAVQDVCQKARWKLPKYTYHKQGPDHTPSFTCVCSVTKNDGAVISFAGQGKTKKEAQQQAAEMMFAELK